MTAAVIFRIREFNILEITIINCYTFKDFFNLSLYLRYNLGETLISKFALTRILKKVNILLVFNL